MPRRHLLEIRRDFRFVLHPWWCWPDSLHILTIGNRLAGLSLSLAVLVPTLSLGMGAVVLAACGVERWSVKTGTDPDGSRINLSSTTTTATSTHSPPR